MGRGRRGGVSSKGSGAESDEPVEMTDAFLDRSARECLRSWPGEGACSTLSIIWWWREEDRKRKEDLCSPSELRAQTRLGLQPADNHELLPSLNDTRALSLPSCHHWPTNTYSVSLLSPQPPYPTTTTIATFVSTLVTGSYPSSPTHGASMSERWSGPNDYRPRPEGHPPNMALAQARSSYIGPARRHGTPSPSLSHSPDVP